MQHLYNTSNKSWKSLAIRLSWAIMRNSQKAIQETLEIIEQKKVIDEGSLLKSPEISG